MVIRVCVCVCAGKKIKGRFSPLRGTKNCFSLPRSLFISGVQRKLVSFLYIYSINLYMYILGTGEGEIAREKIQFSVRSEIDSYFLPHTRWQTILLERPLALDHRSV